MASRLRTIVIGTALTEASDQLVRNGLRVARAAGARLRLVHAFQSPLAYAGEDPSVYGPELIEGKREGRRARLDAQVAKLGIRPEELAGSSVIHGAPHFALAEAAAAAGADLIVVAAAESWGRLATLLGSTADRLVRIASCPVLVIRGPLAVPPRHVLVGVDLSPISGEALVKGLEIVGSLGSLGSGGAPGGPRADAGTAMADWRGPGEAGVAQALLVVETEPPLPDQLGDRSAPPFMPIAPIAPIAPATIAALDRFVAENSPPGWQVTPLIRSGTHAAGKILEMSEDLESDLLVVGSHGREGFSRRLLGSVAEMVLRHSAISVLVVPPAAAGAAAMAAAGADTAASATGAAVAASRAAAAAHPRG
ncbi:MAG TPA: universal stress protein [Thermoanaerobaculia bacterium]|nr:universal stress protein [Thermoanaerobaculia bacterium]